MPGRSDEKDNRSDEMPGRVHHKDNRSDEMLSRMHKMGDFGGYWVVLNIKKGNWFDNVGFKLFERKILLRKEKWQSEVFISLMKNINRP